VREFIKEIGLDGVGKRLINSAQGKVEFAKPEMPLDVLLAYGRNLTSEQENVKRVQLADAYLAGAELAGEGGSSLPEQEGAKEVAATPSANGTNGVKRNSREADLDAGRFGRRKGGLASRF
jgi:hypothetical protein